MLTVMNATFRVATRNETTSTKAASAHDPNERVSLKADRRSDQG